MAKQSQGSFEIDQTLRLARDALERDIARYRMFVFGTVVVTTSVLRLVGLSDTWIPTRFFIGVFAYAVLVLVFLVRYGNRPGLAPVVLIADLAATVLSFSSIRHHGSPETRAANATFAIYIVAAAMVLTLLMNSLRNSTRLALLGGVAAPIVYLTTILSITTFHPGQIAVCLILCLAGVIGAASAVQARRNLDRFARLQLLRRYLSPEAVERVMVDNPDSALSLGGRLVTVTMLAADLRGFTAMSETLSPTEVMAQLNAYHGAMIDVIERHGGAIDKFIGDGTLVVFGLAGSTEDAARAAVDCARDMLAALEPHNAERVRAGAAPLAMGLGVHTGAVIAGNLGVPGRRLEFTVIGDAVNTVSRLEGETKAAGTPLLVSGDTVALLRSANGLYELPPVSLRGKTSTLRVFGLGSHPPTRPPPHL
jgi:class 3 adenylate cyclase